MISACSHSSTRRNPSRETHTAAPPHHETNRLQDRPRIPLWKIQESLMYNKCTLHLSTSTTFRFKTGYASRALALPCCLPVDKKSPISYPESSGSLARVGHQERLWGTVEVYYRRISALKQCKPLRSSQSKKIK